MRRWLILAVAVVAITGCSSGDADPAALPSPSVPASSPQDASSPSPSPSASPSPTPSPTLPPIRPEVDVSVIDVGLTDGRVYPPGHPAARSPRPDASVIEPFVAAGSGWLTRHLEALRAGQVGLIDPDSPFAATASQQVFEAVTTGLVPPDADVTSVVYRVEVAARGGPQWATFGVTVAHGGQSRTASFVFRPSGDGVSLMAAGPGEADR